MCVCVYIYNMKVTIYILLSKFGIHIKTPKYILNHLLCVYTNIFLRYRFVVCPRQNLLNTHPGTSINVYVYVYKHI